MHLLQFSQSIDSPSEIYVAFQWDPLLWPSLPPPQEGHGDTRALGQMPSDPLRCTSTSKSHIHRRYRTIKPRPHWNTTQQTWITSIARSPACTFFFFFLIPSTTASVNLRSKCSGGKKKKKKDRWNNWGRWREGKHREREKKKHKWRTKQPSWSTFATGSQWSHPVFLWGCVWTKRSLKLGYSTVLWHHYGHY